MSKAVKKIGRAIGKVVSGVVKVVAKVLTSAVKFITQPFMGLFGNIGAVPDAGKEADRQQGVLVTIQGGGDVSIPVVYGLRQLGGVTFWAETGSDNNRYLWVGYALSEGPIEGIFQLSIDDEDITVPDLVSNLNAGNIYTLSKPGSRYSGRCQFQLWKGQYFDSPQDMTQPGRPGAGGHLLAQSPSWKPGTNVMNGVAVLMARYEWRQIVTQQDADNNPFGGGIPNIKITIMGRTVASLLPTSTQLNVEYRGGGYAERYSTNPAEILWDYLRNPRYGKGLKNREIDVNSFSRAAVKFNQGVSYTPTTAGPILTCNYVLDTGSSIMSNVKILLQGMRSYLPYIQGRYRLRVEDAGNETDITSGVATIVATFTKDDIVGDIAYSGIDRSAQYTEVEVTYVSPTDKWANQTAYWPATEAERQAVRTEDGGRTNRGAFTFATLTNHVMATDMAQLLFNKSRFQQTCSFRASMRGLEIEPGDNIYIRGTILDFVDDELVPGDNIPWRVISVKINNDYTVEMDCVRNPDFIYPHTRKNDRDIVARPFLPGPGAPYQPPAPEDDIGLNPPGGVIQNPAPPVGIINPPPTDPTNPVDGGGVGGPENPGGSPVAPIEPPPPPFEDAIITTGASYTVSGNLVTARVTWLQPAHPQYAGVKFYYKRNIATETVFTEVESTVIPGAGQTAQHTFENLFRGTIPYLVTARVFYRSSQGQLSYSRFITKFALNVSGAISSENPQDFPEVVTPGWQPPPTTPEPNPRDTILDTFAASTTFVSTGVPTEDLGLNISLVQDVFTRPPNFEVQGINIYYRQQNTEFWRLHTEIFDGSYFPGQAYAFVPALDLGLRQHPNTATARWDFIFRLVYRDRSESTQQLRFMGVLVETVNGNNVMGAGVGVFSPLLPLRESVDKLQPVLLPPGAETDPTLIRIGVEVTRSSFTGQNIIWRIQPPALTDRSRWIGVKVRSRTVPLGGGNAGPFEVTEVYPVPQDRDGFFSITVPTVYDQRRQYVLTPVVRVAPGVRAESVFSVLQDGAIHNRQSSVDYPPTADWTSRLNTRNVPSQNIAELEAQPFPTTNPVPVVKLWNKVFKSGTTNISANNCYFELEYNVSHISGLTGVRLYRRSNTGNNLTRTDITRHYGLGRWEFVEIVPGTNATTLSNGNILVNLRAPILFEQFNPRFGITASDTVLFWTLGQWGANRLIMQQLVGSGGNSTTPASGWDYVLVARTSAGESADCVRLPVIFGTLRTTDNPVEILPRASFNNYTANYKRNITPGTDGSVAAAADNILNISNTTTGVYVRPTANRGGNIV
jgi:hypothetical protein